MNQTLLKSKIPSHYYPDFIINNKIIEIKGYKNGIVNTKIKQAKKVYKNNYIVLEAKDVIKLNLGIPKNNIWKWYSLQKKKYGDLLNIIYSPYKELMSEN